jgi:hypothetical protein
MYQIQALYADGWRVRNIRNNLDEIFGTPKKIGLLDRWRNSRQFEGCRYRVWDTRAKQEVTR